METLRCHSLGVTLGLLKVPVREDGLVRVSDNKNCPSSENMDLIFPPGEVLLIVKFGINSSVVSLLQDGCSVHEIDRLSVVSGFEDGLVIEDGASEDPRGCLQQVPGPGVAGARVGDESPGGKTVSHHKPGPELPTLGV